MIQTKLAHFIISIKKNKFFSWTLCFNCICCANKWTFFCVFLLWLFQNKCCYALHETKKFNKFQSKIQWASQYTLIQTHENLMANCIMVAKMCCYIFNSVQIVELLVIYVEICARDVRPLFPIHMIQQMQLNASTRDYSLFHNDVNAWENEIYRSSFHPFVKFAYFNFVIFSLLDSLLCWKGNKCMPKSRNDINK